MILCCLNIFRKYRLCHFLVQLLKIGDIVVVVVVVCYCCVVVFLIYFFFQFLKLNNWRGHVFI